MNTTERWNKIVEHFNKHFNDKEEVIQNLWENIFIEFFGYSMFGEEIERHRNIRIGSTERVITDIIIKDGDSDLFIVELKQHNLSRSSAMELQLMSYLKQLRLDTGILVCNKIYVYDYDYSKGDDEQDYAVIEFKADNPNGVQFIEMFSKGAFKKSAVEEFIRSQNKSLEKIACIKNELTSELVIDLLKTHFADKYGATEFDKVIEHFNITITPKYASTARTVVERKPNQTEEIRCWIRKIINEAKVRGDEYVDIIAEDIKRNKFNDAETVQVCNAMNSIMKNEYRGEILNQPPSGLSTTLKIRYYFKGECFVSDMSNKISSSEAIRLCRDNGLDISKNKTFASRNKTSPKFWANPSVNFLQRDWWLILNDFRQNTLFVFMIPANTLTKSHVLVRSDKPHLIDLTINCDDNSFEDSRSKIKFATWFVKKIEY
ncbi:MAG: type I restriction enzyme HsdR N-terminal domain-containing protein [Oscillospiraceae bacterium]|nr:type I restriction enzyme HsdR N-terminal domain-containing protein [Oscillospiraceae bacterium]